MMGNYSTDKKCWLLTFLLFPLYLFSVTPGNGQDIYCLTLSEVSLPVKNRNFNVVEVIDGRENKNQIGWVETGAFNKKKFAVFKNPLPEEIQTFIEKTISPQSKTPIAIRVNFLHVSEHTGNVRAEISMDYFLMEREDQYLFITSTHSVSEIPGLDATNFHAENLGNAISKGIYEFSQRNWKESVNRIEIYSKDNLLNGVETKLNLAEIRILNTTVYKNGIYKNFSDFLNNDPSISNYEVKLGKRIKLWLLKDGNRISVSSDVYGFAHEGEIYIFFNNNFFPLRKYGDTFYFTGPYIVDAKSTFKGGLYFGIAGGAIAATTTGKHYEYKIDMKTGFVEGSRGL